jgi:guanylate kinase
VTPFPVILSAPSGAGKTSIARALLSRRADLAYSVSATTRPPRDGEVDGIHYHFVSDDEFARRRRAGDFAEYADVHGRWYGTLKRTVADLLGAGKHVLMDIDVQGAAQFVKAFPQSVTVFVLPPSIPVLIERLTARNTEDAATLERRLRSALAEVERVREYQYVVVNDVLEDAVGRVAGIIDAEAMRLARRHGVEEMVEAWVEALREAIGRGR